MVERCLPLRKLRRKKARKTGENVELNMKLCMLYVRMRERITESCGFAAKRRKKETNYEKRRMRRNQMRKDKCRSLISSLPIPLAEQYTSLCDSETARGTKLDTG